MTQAQSDEAALISADETIGSQRPWKYPKHTSDFRIIHNLNGHALFIEIR